MNSNNPGEQHNHRRKAKAIIEPSSSALDGIILFRFAHMLRSSSSGGVEAYLKNLNRQLLERNKMQILQMYVTAEGEASGVEVERIGRGELIWIPSFIKSNLWQQRSKMKKLWAKINGPFGTQSIINHDLLLSTLANYQINLAVFHWISEDSPIVLDYLNRRSVPFVVVNHFQNARLNRRCIRRQISKARAVGGVSSVNVPSFLSSRFTNLSDGIDTDFFQPGKAIPLERKIKDPLIMLPSRITEGKGHIDAVKALGWLAHARISAVLVFAGRSESPAFMEKLQRVISEEGVQERVIFAGKLSSEELRNWYAASSLVLLPSYSEGLGKVLLEAQSMERPAAAYEVGGVTEAIQHSETGYLVKKGDIEGLASRLKEFIEDPDMRREMGKRGRTFVIERFSMESLTIRHEEFYAKTLNK